MKIKYVGGSNTCCIGSHASCTRVAPWRGDKEGSANVCSDSREDNGPLSSENRGDGCALPSFLYAWKGDVRF